MPVIPSVAHEAKKSGRPALPAGQLTAEEAAAQESMEVYLKPVNYYNILQERAKVNPSFLARGLRYKLQEKHIKKLQLSVIISEAIGDKIHTQTIFPLYILLARQDPTPNGETLRSSSYHFKKAIKLTSSDGTQAKFNLPEIKKLSAEVKDRSFSILLVSGADHTNPNEMDRNIVQTLNQSYAGKCVMGKIPIEDILHNTCETPNLSLGEKLQSISIVSMQSCRMKATFPNVVTFQFPYNSESVQVPVLVTAEEDGAKAIDKNNILPDSLPPGLGLKLGEVTFGFKGYNDKVCGTEIMPDYSCAFCELACASYKGLKYHLQAYHDLFDFEFHEDEKYQLVNISYNKSNDFISQNFGILAGEDKKFFFCHKALKRTKIEEDQTQLADHVGHVTLGSVTPPATINSDFRGPNAAGVPVEQSDPANQILQNQQFFRSCGSQEVVVGDNSEGEADDTVTDLEDQRNEKYVMELWNSFKRKHRLAVAVAHISWACEAFTAQYGKDLQTPELACRTLLLKRQSFHSREAQSMILEEVLAEELSDDEADDAVADLEDKRMLNDLVDVTEEKKDFMHLWNSFVRKKRVAADAHIPWACEAFLTEHEKDLVRTPILTCSLRSFMTTLRKCGLIDVKTFNNCKRIIENISKN